MFSLLSPYVCDHVSARSDSHDDLRGRMGTLVTIS